MSNDGLMETLAATVTSRTAASSKTSYTATLLRKGQIAIARKVCEESSEILIEAVKADSAAMVRESADLLYHLAVLWHAMGITPQTVADELQHRQHQSGLMEKASRQEKEE